MRGLVLYEYSGRVRDAFIAKGHTVVSVDFLPTENPGPHYQGNVWDFLEFHPAETFDFIIAHPPCTRLCNSGVLRLYNGGKKENGIDPVKWRLMTEAAREFKNIWDLKCDRLLIENPVMHGHAARIIGVKQSYTIQPYEFGENASKRTAIWSRGFNRLKPTKYFEPRIVNGQKRWANQTDSGQNKLAPSETRGKDRAKTYSGIADAMADQLL